MREVNFRYVQDVQKNGRMIFHLLTSYESKNVRRFVTGLLFGYARTNLFVKSILLVYQAEYNSFLKSREMRRSENTVFLLEKWIKCCKYLQGIKQKKEGKT